MAHGLGWRMTDVGMGGWEKRDKKLPAGVVCPCCFPAHQSEHTDRPRRPLLLLLQMQVTSNGALGLGNLWCLRAPVPRACFSTVQLFEGIHLHARGRRAALSAPRQFLSKRCCAFGQLDAGESAPRSGGCEAICCTGADGLPRKFNCHSVEFLALQPGGVCKLDAVDW